MYLFYFNDGMQEYKVGIMRHPKSFTARTDNERFREHAVIAVVFMIL